MLTCRTWYTGFLNLSTIGIGGWKITFCGGGEGCPVRWRMFRTMPFLYPLDASSTHTHPHPPAITTKNVFSHCQMSPGKRNHPHLRTTADCDENEICSLEMQIIYLVKKTTPKVTVLLPCTLTSFVSKLASFFKPFSLATVDTLLSPVFFKPSWQFSH